MNKYIKSVSPRPLHPLDLMALAMGALLFFLAGNSSEATVFNIAEGDVEALIAALDAAEDGDVINLAEDGVYTLTEINNTRNGTNGLPIIRRDITIQGNGATIQRDSAAPRFRIFYLDGVGPQATFSNLVIKGGEDLFLGGGIYAENSSPAIVNCVFEDNRADLGGGIYNDGGSPLIESCIFQNNFAWFDANGAGMANVNNAAPTIRDSVFRGNFGGGILNVNSSPEITRCVFEDNMAEEGGGMANYDNSNPIITDCLFIDNLGDEDGGAMYNVSSSPILINCFFERNLTIMEHGGAMLNTRGSNPIVTGCLFRDNLAGEGGGGIANFGNSNPEITDSVFENNRATMDGGAIYNSSSSPTLINCSFEGNLTLVEHGGAMLNLGGSSPIVMECSFRDNLAGEGGGGIANFGNSNPEITDSVFENNRAVMGGGIFNFSSSPTITNSLFEGNTVSGDSSVLRFGPNGGGIGNFNNSHPVIIDSAFRFNSAEEAGGGIFSAADSSSEIGSTFFCENDPEHIAGPWEDLGSNQFSDSCEPVDPKELLADLIATVEGMSLNPGIRNSLIAQLSAASSSLEHPKNQKAAPNILGAFIRSVSARRGKQIPSNDAEHLIDAAGTILVSLEKP